MALAMTKTATYNNPKMYLVYGLGVYDEGKLIKHLTNHRYTREAVVKMLRGINKKDAATYIDYFSGKEIKIMLLQY